MRSDKSVAFELRRSGKSYNEIKSRLNLSKATLSDWFSELDWSIDIKRTLTDKAFEKVRPKFTKMVEFNRRRWKRWRENARKEAKNDFSRYRNDLLFCAGVMLYWGEGDKNPKNPVRVSNTDPGLLRVFVKFLKHYAKVPSSKIKAFSILYPDLDEKTSNRYWSSKIGLPLKNFYKTQHIQGRHKTRRLGYGIGAVVVSSGQLKEKILQWIELYSRM